jgi:hypothetical protein
MLKGKFGYKNKEKVECTLLISLYRLFVPATSWYGFGNSYLMYVVTVRDSPPPRNIGNVGTSDPYSLWFWCSPILRQDGFRA